MLAISYHDSGFLWSIYHTIDIIAHHYRIDRLIKSQAYKVR